MIMGILLGLVAAVLYGSSDFVGGVTSRRFGPLRVTVIGCAVAPVLARAALIVSGGPETTLRPIAQGLARSVGGPLSAVGAAGVPVVAGVAMGERPSLLAVAGVVVALPAIVLVAASGSVRGKLGAAPKGLTDGLVAGVAFGILFVGPAQAGHNAGLWPVASEQTGTLLVVLAVAIKTREPLRIPVRAAGLPVLAGASGMAATLAYFYATHFSMLAVAAVLVSLYPGVTVLFARTLLHERFTSAQRAGLGLCALAIAAIALN